MKYFVVLENKKVLNEEGRLESGQNYTRANSAPNGQSWKHLSNKTNIGYNPKSKVKIHKSVKFYNGHRNDMAEGGQQGELSYPPFLLNLRPTRRDGRPTVLATLLPFPFSHHQ